MLSDAQKEQLSAEIMPLFQDLEQDTIQDIARRLRKEKRWTETAELQAKALEKLGHSPAEIRRLVLKKLHADNEFEAMLIKNTLEHKKAIKKQIEATIEQAKKDGDDIVSRAGMMSFADDVSFWASKGQHLKESKELRQLAKEHAKRLEHELKNLTHSTGFKFVGAPIKEERAFNHAMDKAVMNVASGAFSSQQAVEEVVADLEKSGLRKVDFASGISRGIDVAAHLAVRTTLGQMAADISISNAKALGTDLVEVSSHAGARDDGDGPANHAQWQGKVYSITGKPHPEESRRLGYKIESLEKVTGYPNDPSGLCGYNCRHTFYPFVEGISEPNPVEKEPEPVEVDGKVYTYYQSTQKQRRIERELREYKRQHIGGQNRIAAITAKEQQYARFCEKAGLKQNLNRLYVKGYKRDFEYIKIVPKTSKETDSIKPFTNAEYLDFANICKKRCTAKEWELINGKLKDGRWRGYFQSPNSFKINRALRENNLDVLDKRDKQTIKALQNVISRNELNSDTILYRNDSIEVFNGYFDKSISELAKTGEASGQIIKMKSFTSTSFIKSQNLFNDRPVSWEMHAPKGINIFANGFELESEGLLNIGQEIKILNIVDNGGIIKVKAELMKGVGEVVK
ncbi:MAG: ADP-ribosyltransferase [Peptostreptococcaceae bacterium]|nr:ADP-ribosyltransferase [Peptostreptococcaceae bacterium]MDY5738681.1 phage minor capsid protein [Anaerovoracaceae bacterium]